MMAITTNSSMRVKPPPRARRAEEEAILCFFMDAKSGLLGSRVTMWLIR